MSGEPGISAELPPRSFDLAAAEQLASTYLARHGANHLERVVALFAEHAWLEDPVGAPRQHGHAAIREFYRETHARNGRLVFDRVGPVLVGGRELVFHVRARLARDPDPNGGMDVIYAIEVDEAGRITILRAWF